MKRRDMISTREANHHNIKNKGCHYNSNYNVDEVRISDNITSKLKKGLVTSKGLPLGNPLEAPIGTGGSVSFLVSIHYITCSF